MKKPVASSPNMGMRSFDFGPIRGCTVLTEENGNWIFTKDTSSEVCAAERKANVGKRSVKV